MGLVNISQKKLVFLCILDYIVVGKTRGTRRDDVFIGWKKP